jgi:hypothetical protein
MRLTLQILGSMLSVALTAYLWRKGWAIYNAIRIIRVRPPR